MHIISKRPLREFWKVRPDSERALRRWFRTAEKAEWNSFADLRATFGAADQVGRFTVFNICGNKYRLVTVIHYNRKRVYVRNVLTHKEYDRGQWKND
jgi:mRNA interferase HigB